MKIKLIIGTILAAALFAPVQAKAQVDESSINPWRHCGIGAIIFSDNPTAAAISNIIWDSGTTAVSSATISPNACSGEEIQLAEFIEYTYEALVLETAKGSGEHLSSLFNLAGCEASAEKIQTLRGDLSKLTSDSAFIAMDRPEKAFHYYSSFIGVTAAANCRAG